MAGKLICSFAYPVCKETEIITGIESDISWHSLIDEMEFTRTDDGKDDRLAEYMQDAGEEKTAKSSTQMRYSVQYMAAGTEFVQNFIFLDGVTDLELGAFYAGLRRWFAVPRLGGMAAKGFGLFDAKLCGEEFSVKNGAVSIGAPGRLIEDYEEAKRQLNARLSETVRMGMSADVPPGSFLSGGYDSFLVSAIAPGCSESPVQTSPLGSTYEKYDGANAVRA